MPEDAIHDDLDSIWRRVTEDLRASLPASTYDLWLDPLRPVSAHGAALRVAAPRSIRAWVDRRYRGAIESALRAQDCGLDQVIVLEEGADSAAAGSTQEMESVKSPEIDPRHTFERFVIGSGNRLAHAAALAVAELPGEAYNPLFLHGPPGLGKTHLLGAIVDYLRRRRPELTVHYTTTEQFTSEFVTSLRKDGPELFKLRYRNLDAMLIDDVQALEGKEHTQEEFVQTFNTLHAAGKQIVLSSDRPPEAISRIADRLRDRFEWGLRVAIGPPDLRTRTALLWRMSSEVPLEITDPAVLHDIAGLAAGNVRRLEGALTRIAALSSVLGEPVNRALIRRALEEPTGGNRSSPPDHYPDPQTPSIPAIQAVVCSVAGTSQEAMLSPSRASDVSRSRQIAMYLSRELTDMSLAEIARHFDRDHTTILHAVRTISTRAESDAELTDTIHRARELLGAQEPAPLGSSQQPNDRQPIPSTDESPQVKP
jgi:chromosomal replication initiator protein